MTYFRECESPGSARTLFGGSWELAYIEGWNLRNSTKAAALTHARTPTGYKMHRASTTNSVEVAPAKKQKQKNNMMLRGTVVVTKELLRGRRW